jgi:hypothetical protein
MRSGGGLVARLEDKSDEGPNINCMRFEAVFQWCQIDAVFFVSFYIMSCTHIIP